MKRALSIGAVAIAAAATAVMAAAPAQAISRSQCGSSYLQMFSPSTTCWANSGGAYVQLAGVYAYSSGNNTGGFQGSAGSNLYTTSFGRYSGTRNVPTQNVTYIYIN